MFIYEIGQKMTKFPNILKAKNKQTKNTPQDSMIHLIL